MSKQLILKSFSDFLGDNLSGFNELPEKVQFHFCHLSFSLSNKRYQHQKFKGYSFLPYQAIYSKFGRNFLAINKKLGFFDITENWSKAKKYTRGIKLSEYVAMLKMDFLKREPILSEVISDTGKILRTLPSNAIMKEVSITSRKNTAIKSTIEVNHKKANELVHKLLSIKNDTGLDIGYLLNSIRTIKHYSYTKIAGKNTLIQRYSYSDSGRLYSKGVNLQNAPKLVRDAFLSGCWNHDFDNCHYSIFHQLAKRVGQTYPYIRHYLEHKKTVREEIANDIGISIKCVKIALLGIMYGAKESLWHESAIPRLIGDKTPALYNHSIFKGISEEIRTSRKKIIKQWPDTTQRSIINAMGKPIKKSEDERFIMAHIQQGIEAKMLHVAIDYCGDDILLLSHDGFSSKTKIDTDVVTTQIKREMNFDMTMTTEIHQIKLDKIDNNNQINVPKLVLTKNGDIKI